MIHYLDNIAHSVKTVLPMLDRGIYLARIDEEGRILMQSSPNQNEYVYAGIRDNDANYFYIRHRDSGEIFFEESQTKSKISCGSDSSIARYELRIVAVLKNWCPYNAEEMIRRALMNTGFADIEETVPTRMTIKNVDLKTTRSCIDSIQVLREESPNPKQFDKNNIFVSVDFDLYMEYTYY